MHQLTVETKINSLSLKFLITRYLENSGSLPKIKARVFHPTVGLSHISYTVMWRANGTEGEIIGGKLSEMYN